MIGLLLRLLGKKNRGGNGAPISLVMLTADDVTEALANGVRHAIETADELRDLDIALGGMTPMPGTPNDAPGFMMPFTARGKPFGVIIAGFPYVSDPEAAAADSSSAEMANAFRKHRSWFAVDAMDPRGDGADDYRVIGRVSSVVMPASGLAFYMPNRARFSFPSGSLLEAMASGSWLEVFDQVGSTPGVVEREPDDEALRMAAEEARSRLVTFVSAFETGAGRNFAVKAPFIDDNGATEHMWVTIESYADEVFRGTLNSEPRVVGHVREGEAVEVEREMVEDWLYEVDGKPRGGFQVRVLSPEAAREFEDL
ncbi:MAG: DUF2314 domain-containing protein [Planctomycetota bacterium]